MFKREMLHVYFIAGTSDVPDGDLERVLKEALEAGITMFQFREKGSKAKTGQEKQLIAERLFNLCKDYKVPFIVNDDVALAKAIGADGIHLGQDDEKVENIIDDFQGKIIGLSVGNFEEYDQSDLTHVDYIGVGPIYETSSKSDAKKPGGIELIRKMRLYDEDIPIVAIGGITSSNCEMIIASGADGISTISSIARSNDIKQVVTDYLQYYK
ncbi:thiamine phosphate synthase [Macrococcoides canis]|uniref:Thiamine-phosphate synthase n=1 Tax=Macrococcoides canis TaxID=1855823 RepID=A0A4V3BFY6_9STAP|nr:thiamine phosphate synthase [Macrococcus canis]MEE1106732.1 thiamine phosphate synthase [Macrococcus canis]TDM16290.1 thiamine phosphate synthase [Macrococcus canis]TDM20013.1 thiamine phosphate synthase [Macrococcus canis]TDM29393.1 thiamine phosphate synthase [Macrococcus canis]TDM32090.1 thiamine phosphate synthase [Macrococcus canis]